MKAAEVLIITVNYQGAADTLSFLGHLRHVKGFHRVNLTIVDNSSVDDSCAKIRAAISDLENVQLLESVTNRGYFGAARWALKEYLNKREFLPDWVIVCNNDIVIDDQDFFARLSKHDPAVVGVLAPEIRSERTLSDQNPFLRERPSRKKLLNIRIWFSSYYLMLFKEILSEPIRFGREKFRNLISGHPRTYPHQRLRPIYCPHGAFVIFSRRYFELGGLIDDGVLLYAEEFSVAEICRRLGLSVLHDTGLKVQHREHSTTGSNFSRLKYKQKREALNYVIAKYLSDLA